MTNINDYVSDEFRKGLVDMIKEGVSDLIDDAGDINDEALDRLILKAEDLKASLEVGKIRYYVAVYEWYCDNEYMRFYIPLGCCSRNEANRRAARYHTKTVYEIDADGYSQLLFLQQLSTLYDIAERIIWDKPDDIEYGLDDVFYEDLHRILIRMERALEQIRNKLGITKTWQRVMPIIPDGPFRVQVCDE